MKIDEILRKYFLGKQSEEELAMLQAWKLESEENLAAINQLETYWKNYENIKDYKEFDKISAWDSISEQIENPVKEEIEETQKEEAKTIAFPLWKVAASLFIALGAFYFIKTGGGAEESISQLALVDVEVLTEKALEDGSMVWFNAHTKADLSQFTKEKRTIELQEGEAYFEVQSDKEHPFVVSAGDFNIEVVGTEFNVSYLNNQIEIFVQEGRVLVMNGNRKVYLSAGDMIVGSTAAFSKKENANQNTISWKTKRLEFNNSQLSEVLEDLSNHFQVDITLKEGVDHKNCFLNTSFSEEKLEDVLSELEALFQISSHKAGNTIVIDKVNC